MKTYTIPVNFTVTYTIGISGAEDEARAKELAEEQAAAEFEENLNEGMLGTSDFACEAQDSIEL